MLDGTFLHTSKRNTALHRLNARYRQRNWHATGHQLVGVVGRHKTVPPACWLSLGVVPSPRLAGLQNTTLDSVMCRRLVMSNTDARAWGLRTFSITDATQGNVRLTLAEHSLQMDLTATSTTAHAHTRTRGDARRVAATTKHSRGHEPQRSRVSCLGTVRTVQHCQGQVSWILPTTRRHAHTHTHTHTQTCLMDSDSERYFQRDLEARARSDVGELRCEPGGHHDSLPDVAK